MCTAAYFGGRVPLLGRTLDYECSFGERLWVMPRRYPLCFTDGSHSDEHEAVMGMAYSDGGTPLFFDAVNSSGLAMAALNFRDFARYMPPMSGMRNIASFELIGLVLSLCRTVSEAEELLCGANITDVPYSAEILPMPLHWIIADRQRAITVEQTERGLRIYENRLGVMTNSPPFDFHLANASAHMCLDSSSCGNRLSPSGGLSEYSRGFGAMGLPGDYSSPSRFIRALFCAEKTFMRERGEGRISDFFHVMESVSIPRGCILTDSGEAVMTYYTSCMRLDEPTYYLTTYDSRQIATLPLSEVDTDGGELLLFGVGFSEVFRKFESISK